MSTSPPKPSAPQDPFGLVKAIFIGLALGAGAVMAGPFLFPPDETGRTLAQPMAGETGRRSAKAAGAGGEKLAPPAELKNSPAQQEDRAGGKPGPAASPNAAQATPASEPVLVPAAVIKFPNPAAARDMTAALDPLLSLKLSDDDIKAVKEAVDAAGREDDGDAREAIKKITSPAAKIFAEWRRLHSAKADFGEVMAFRAAHPLFPEPPQDSAIERSLFLSDAPDASVIKYYTNRVPLTGAGYANLGGAMMNNGAREQGLALISFAWGRYTMDPAVEEKVRSRFGSLLTEGDRGRRDRLLAANAALKADPGKNEARAKGKHALRIAGRSKRGAAGGNSKRAGHRRKRRGAALDAGPSRSFALLSPKAAIPDAQPLLKLVQVNKTENKAGGETGDATSKSGSQKSETGDAVKKPADKSLQAKAAANAFKLAEERTGGPATLLHRLKALRREESDKQLWSLLRSISPDNADLADPERWWDFRRSEVRRALSEDRPRTAYAIARAHGPLAGEDLSEAEFLAGWIALRFMKDPRLAMAHFEKSSVLGFGRYEARAAYWTGRAQQELGARAEAQKSFAEASARFYTFYGGLAKQAMRKAACEFRAPPQPAEETIAAFVSEDAFKAVMIAKQAGLDGLLVNFVLDLARQVRDPGQMTLLMELAGRTVPAHVAVRSAKIALLRGYATEAYAFPVLLPKFSEFPGSAKLEAALLNALTRQESEFNTGTVSRVGARGLMQLMPQTAKQLAAGLKMKYEMARLVSDPSYNVTLGSAFLAQLLAGYDGSYILSLAAYNAGPGRVAGWIKDFGDPRDKSVDPIDWVERIPFTETRQYVQRIIESVQLYRCRLESSKTRFQIVEDLHRGRPGKLPELTDVSGSAELDQAP